MPAPKASFSKGEGSPSSINTRNPRENTNSLPASSDRIEYLIEGDCAGIRRRGRVSHQKSDSPDETQPRKLPLHIYIL
ncbi:hypothetical protein EVAR_45817_1 [Eumeta japonica]|uniref:Uncharacterized protein n=1 Tax=Eumeta variegata TaxID=151549 RepID=A0A4C1WKK2_EUMVA|nr:hypothetical protein EVAR_45817_1 [Eumeta japonica]